MRHRFHAICPYFAMFPEAFVEKHLAASRRSGVVFDPFCGRGTTIFESLLRGRDAAGCDIHPVAVCVTGAKADPPSTTEVYTRLANLETRFAPPVLDAYAAVFHEFFDLCFHPETFSQVLFLRQQLDWQFNRTDRFIAALSLGALHGESHRSPSYFSNRMPRTISTKPAYSVRWWRRHGYSPPRRDVFAILRQRIEYRFRTAPPALRGRVEQGDARKASTYFPDLLRRVTDVITSPPYLDTTHYKEDQWLRLWFLRGEPKSTYDRTDARHYNKAFYWTFLQESWAGLAPLLADTARLVIRIGGRRLAKNEALEQLQETLTHGLRRSVRPIDSGVTTLVKKTQANTFRGAKASPTVEHDFCFTVS